VARVHFGAYCPWVNLAREASTLSLATPVTVFYRPALIPLGKFRSSPKPLLARAALLFHLSAPFHQEIVVMPNKDPKPANAKPRKAPKRSSAVPEPMGVINPSAAGIDVHSDNHVICVPADRDPERVRTFGANTADLHEIAAWLKKCRVTTVAMESTGVYWIPLFELLELQGFEVYLVEPGQLSRCGARPKTDVLDAQWIQRLHSYGLLRGSFRPPDSVLALRGYWRQRQMQVRYAASHVQHMQKALEQMNVKLTEVVSDITGLTGMLIIDAILAGERDPMKLAKLRHERCHRSVAEIARALEGTWRPEHLFELRQAKALFYFHHTQINECDEQIRAELAKLVNRAGTKGLTGKRRRRGRKHNDVRFDARFPLLQALGVDLTKIEGIDVGTALVILAETGGDISRFPSEKHFASWLGLCPRQHESNGTKRRTRRKGRHRVAIALRTAARSVGRTMTPLGQFYRRIRSRIGGLGAVKATAHKLARLVYQMLKYGEEYVQTSMEDYAAKMQENVLKSLRRKAMAMGYDLAPRPT
jgi:transposase